MIDLFIDIETLPGDEAHRETILADVKANFKAPSNLTKGQAAADLGLTSDDVKFISLGDLKERWAREMASVKCADVAEDEFRKGSFQPERGNIACISVGHFDNNKFECVTFKAATMQDEREMLLSFFAYVNDIAGGKMFKFVGHNILKFDLPFIWKRAIINGVSPIKGVKWIDARHDQHHYDTMIAWAGFGGRISADKLAQVLGVQGKSDMDGSKVYDTWKTDPQKVCDYCQDDVQMVADIYARLTV